MQTFQETDMMAGVNLIAWDGHRKMNRPRRLSFVIAAMLAVSVIVAPKFARFHAHAQEDGQKQNWPWMNTMLSPDERADLVLKELTLDEKIDLVHGNGMPGWGKPRPNAYLGNGGGRVVGKRVKCEEGEHVVGDIKHYAANDQESGRNEVDAVIGKRALRESDLLAFEIGIGIANPGAVMCSYNSVNGDFACENKYLLTDVLKKGWGFKGFVVSDWAGTHSTVKASATGLDNEEPFDQFFGAKLKEAVQAGKIPQSELDAHVPHISRPASASSLLH